MPRGDKSSYTGKQKRQAAHIEDSYEARGVPKDEAEARAWATVNKRSGGGQEKRLWPGQNGYGNGKKAAENKVKKASE